jgi:peptidoglycan/xylan/chitin deacetylase (PgdA/CDA1 family)
MSAKSLTKSTLCALYKYSGVMRFQETLTRLRGHSFLAILLFHRVTDEIPEDGLTVSTARFRRICRMLRQRFHVVPLADVFRIVRSGRRIPARTVAITFDDCYRDNLDAARILAEFALPACFFIPTAAVGSNLVFDWDRRLKPLPNLNWDEVREIARLGFEIGSHTVTHPNMAEISIAQARQELFDSKKTLETQLGQSVRWFAYPFGGRQHFTSERLDLALSAGYEGCLSAYGGFVQPGSDRRLLPREPVPYFESVLNLELHLAGCLDWMYSLKRRVGLLT